MKNKIGFIGLGKMGYPMVERLLFHRYKVIVWNRSSEKIKLIEKKGAIGSHSIEDLLSKFGKKRKIIWLMLPSGKPTDEMIKLLLGKLKHGDILINGANDFYKNAEDNFKLCHNKGIHFLDIGVSGGIHGLKNGFTLMIGGEINTFKKIEPLCKSLAPRGGYAYFGNAGNGHFVKSVHNIIEYIYLQGIAEGIELLDKKNIDIRKALSVWKPASVVKSWIVELALKALERDDFKKINSSIMSLTIDELIKTKNSVKGFTPAFNVATAIRKQSSNKKFKLGKKIIAAIRREFGGHSILKS